MSVKKQSTKELKAHIKQLKKQLKELEIEERVARSRETKSSRLTENHPHYGVHLRHCYPKEGIDGFPAYCKYGEDDICPAALFEDPWTEYLRWKDKQ